MHIWLIKKSIIVCWTETKGMLKFMELQHTWPNIQIPFEFFDCHERMYMVCWQTSACEHGSAWNLVNVSPVGKYFSVWIVWSDVQKVHQQFYVMYVCYLMSGCLYWTLIQQLLKWLSKGKDSAFFFFFFTSNFRSGSHCNAFQHFVTFYGSQIKVDGTMEMKQTHCIYNTKRLQYLV